MVVFSAVESNTGVNDMGDGAWWLLTVVLILIMIVAAFYSVPRKKRSVLFDQAGSDKDKQCPICRRGTLEEYFTPDDFGVAEFDGVMCNACGYTPTDTHV